jgi:hypothetical protein
MAEPPAPVLLSIVPVAAVPERLQRWVSRPLAEWGYSWADITFAGTARISRQGLQIGDEEQWVLAITAASLRPGDEIVSGGGRATGVSVGQFASGVLPATPYRALVYECLGTRGGGGPGRQQPQSPPSSPMTADTAPGARGLPR